MSDEMQALCFLAGANSIFYGERLLTTANPDAGGDEALFARLGIKAVLTWRCPQTLRSTARRSGAIFHGTPQARIRSRR